MLDFHLLRTLVQRAGEQAPIDVTPTLPIIDFQEQPSVTFRIAFPQSEGPEFSHWRFAREFGLVRVLSDRNSTAWRILGVTAAGHEFVALAQSDSVWRKVIEICEEADALTLGNILAELRREARIRLGAARRKLR